MISSSMRNSEQSAEAQTVPYAARATPPDCDDFTLTKYIGSAHALSKLSHASPLHFDWWERLPLLGCYATKYDSHHSPNANVDMTSYTHRDRSHQNTVHIRVDERMRNLATALPRLKILRQRQHPDEAYAWPIVHNPRSVLQLLCRVDIINNILFGMRISDMQEPAPWRSK